MHITLYRKYRPSTFSEIAGQKEIVRTIENSLKNGKVSHAYLFTGPRGVGKTTLARLIAKGVNCLENDGIGEPCNHCENCLDINNNTFMDMIEIDAASNRGIDEIRELKEKINYQPVKGKKKVYIIDEVHMLTKEAFNALLKTLEEPPEHVIFILATTEADKILPTIISRCQRYDFKTLSLEEMTEKLKYICDKENIEIEDEIYPIIYENAGGSMRDSISILERLIVTCLNEKVTLERAEKVLDITPLEQMKIFLNYIEEKDYVKLVNILDKYWNESIDIEGFFKDFAKYIKNLISRQEIDLKMGLSIIGAIFTSLNKFKYEEDKRLVGYVIVDNIIKNQNKNTKEVKVIEKVITKEVPVNNENIKVEKANNLEINMELINSKWKEVLDMAMNKKIALRAFLNNASPYRFEGDTLYIAFPGEDNFSMTQMKEKAYNEALLTSAQDIINPKIKIEYMLLGDKPKTKEETSDLTQKIVDFFGGEII